MSDVFFSLTKILETFIKLEFKLFNSNSPLLFESSSDF